MLPEIYSASILNCKWLNNIYFYIKFYKIIFVNIFGWGLAFIKFDAF